MQMYGDKSWQLQNNLQICDYNVLWITEFINPRALNIQGMDQSLTLPQARIDAILEVVNLAELKHAAQENGLAYVRELFKSWVYRTK